MDWLTVFGLTTVSAVVLFALLRAERRAVWVIVVSMLLPGIVLIGGWASLFGHWPETLLGWGLAVVLVGGWWLAVGRHLARPDSDSIRVWGQEKLPKTSPQEAAALRAELQRAQQEKERLEAELRRLKGEPPPRNGNPPAT
jgi:hypothetical protein